MATRSAIMAIMAIASFTACGRIDYSVVTDTDMDGGAGAGDGSQPEPPDGAVQVDADCGSGDPFELGEADTANLQAVVAAFNASCPDYCWLAEPMGFTYSACVAPDPSLEEVVTAATNAARDLYQIDARFEFGQIVPPGEVASTSPLPLSSEVDNLLDELRATTGSAVSEAWSYEEQTPCPNCTTFEDVIVMWYADTRWIVVLAGGHGYDS